jgi:transcriptional regulator with XRE-family HTH domain
VEGVELPEPADTDFGIDIVGEIVAEPADTDLRIRTATKVLPPPPSPLGAGYLILVVRELTGMSQRVLARAIGTSQPTLATLETGNRVPTIRTLLRVADATGFELVIGLRRPNIPAPNPTALHAQWFDLLGTLRPNPEDDLADFVVLREPSPLEGPR